MRISIDSAVLERFPETHIALIQGQGIDNAQSADAVRKIVERAVGELHDRVDGLSLLDHPHIAAWRETYRAFGANPNKFRPSAEALARRALKNGGLPQISSVVDLYNAASVAFLLPVGAYDLDAVDGAIVLRFAQDGERFSGIGAQTLDDVTQAHEIIYGDDCSVLTRHWNYRDCDKTKVTERSANVLVLCEAAHPAIETDTLRRCQARLRETILSVCGGRVRSLWLDQDSSAVELTGW